MLLTAKPLENFYQQLQHNINTFDGTVKKPLAYKSKFRVRWPGRFHGRGMLELCTHLIIKYVLYRMNK